MSMVKDAQEGYASASYELVVSGVYMHPGDVKGIKRT
jgi:hypothetical protein